MDTAKYFNGSIFSFWENSFHLFLIITVQGADHTRLFSQFFGLGFSTWKSWMLTLGVAWAKVCLAGGCGLQLQTVHNIWKIWKQKVPKKCIAMAVCFSCLSTQVLWGLFMNKDVVYRIANIYFFGMFKWIYTNRHHHREDRILYDSNLGDASSTWLTSSLSSRIFIHRVFSFKVCVCQSTAARFHWGSLD